MIQKKVLVSGCSFSESKYSEMSQVGNWIPYSDLIQKNHPNIHLKNTARASAGNSEIAENIVDEVIKSNFNWDFVIIQWSAIGRSVNKTEKEWLEEIIDNNLIHRLPNYKEYFDKNLPEGRTSSQNNLVSYYHYKNSLTKIKLTQTFLEYYNIPHLFFWGWQQINDNIYKEHQKIIDSIYSPNWWYPSKNKFEGLLQYGVTELGEQNAVSDDDLHPSSETHELFFNNIINPIISKL